MRSFNRFPFALLAVIAACTTAQAQCKLETIHPVGSSLIAGARTIRLGAADDDARPRAWQGPIQFGQCTLALSIIEGPMIFAAPNYLYVPTYSGSNRTLLMVNLDSCVVQWTSPRFTGVIKATPHALVLGKRQIALNTQCLPQW